MSCVRQIGTERATPPPHTHAHMERQILIIDGSRNGRVRFHEEINPQLVL